VQAEPPDTSKLPEGDIIGVTVILLKCSYINREFVRVGYYVNNEYMDETLKETPPPTVQFDKLFRNILSEKPRVTRWVLSEQALRRPVAKEALSDFRYNGTIAYLRMTRRRSRSRKRRVTARNRTKRAWRSTE
jgi:hypothetical protein